jgi:hypothetical protein
MKYKVCSLLLILAINVQTAWSQSGQLDEQWRRVEALAAGESVKIRQMTGKTVEGFVVAVTNDAVTATTKGGAVTIPRSDIREVKVKSSSRQKQNAFIGGAIGGTSGVVTAVILDGALTDGDGVSEAAAVFFGAIGVAAGLTVGLLRSGYRTIYKVR